MNNIHIFTVPLPPKGKARARVTKNGTYMQRDYVAWKRRFGLFARAAMPQFCGIQLRIASPIKVWTVFYTKSGNCSCDLDNAHAAVLDALQDAGLIKNDKQVRSGIYEIKKGGKDIIEVTIEILE